MNVSFTSQGWDDLTYWLEKDRKMLPRVLRLIEDCLRHPHEGIGKPEPLRGDRQGGGRGASIRSIDWSIASQA